MQGGKEHEKRSIWKKAIAGALAIALMLGAFPAVNCVRVEAAVKLVNTKGKDAKDVAALKKLIAKAQKQNKYSGVSADMNDDEQYEWKNGKLVGLKWINWFLTGAWDFSSLKNLTDLSCVLNPGLSKLDVSGCTKLTSLSCGNNNLSKLDVSKCTKLTELDCRENKLSKLDVSKCTKLTYLSCYDNNLSKLDVSKCPKLTSLYCGSNKLSKLNVSKCTKLTDLSCYNNKLSKLDVSKCTKLTSLSCGYNKLSNLDVIKCTKQEELYCSGNKLKKVTISKKVAEYLDVDVDDGVKIVKK